MVVDTPAVETPVNIEDQGRGLSIQGSRSTPTIADHTAKAERFHPIPKKAALYSAIIPGSGQLYNRQYWKIPVIYAGMGACAYFLIDNSTNYRRYRTAFVNRSNPLAQQTELNRSAQDLVTLRDFYKKNLDLTVLLTVVGYTLQSLDALTFAHLNNFDISKDISMQVSPVLIPGGVGLGLVVNW